MRRAFALVLLSLAGAVLTAAAPAQDEPAALQARTYRTARGQKLSAPSTSAPASIVARFLQARGVSAATARTLQTASTDRAATGLTLVRIEQQLAGLRVHDAYAKAALNDRGELVHVIESLAPVRSTSVSAARIDERQALRAALQALHPGSGQDPALVGRQGNTATFAKSPFFYAAPTVERVAILMTSGAFKTAFLVETWKDRGNLLHDTLVGGDGRVLSVELRTSTDSYNVFAIDPGKTPQSVVSGPGAGNAQSPAGWVFGGTQSSTSIAGNNAHAYLDTDANNAADPGGDPVADGNFVTAADLTVSPSTAANKNVAAQNLFYLNNVIHDTLYTAGFNEAAANFQEDNFGKGGRGSDSVNAEAQDGAGTDNANFATPREGQNPRMQMFLWSGKGDHQVVVNSPFSATYRAQGAAFGPALNTTGITQDVALANDGTGTPSDACEAMAAGSLSGKIALIDRGTCTFVIKVKNAQNAGALGAIVANHLGDSIFTMGGTDATITIPSVFIGKTDGGAIKAALLSSVVNATERRTDPAPLMRDGDVDSDIVWHEYGHGLTWRMIGRMNGPLSGAIGEGMSDVLSVINNDDDVVGEYAFDDPLGIRTAPYTSYPRTYGDVAGTEVHFDGEVYGAIGWRLWQNFQGAGLTKDNALTDIVDGMNFTPAHPSFEQMRDGILQSVANSGSGHECLVWDAFAHYGVGVGAKGTVRGSSVIVTESFQLPAGCP